MFSISVAKTLKNQLDEITAGVVMQDEIIDIEFTEAYSVETDISEFRQEMLIMDLVSQEKIPAPIRMGIDSYDEMEDIDLAMIEINGEKFLWWDGGFYFVDFPISGLEYLVYNATSLTEE